MLSDEDYHMTRATMEEALAEGAPPAAAQAHLQLAELHRARSQASRFIDRLSTGRLTTPAPRIVRTDKEA